LMAATSERAILQSGAEIPLQDARLHCAIGTSAGSSETRLPQGARQAARQYRPGAEGLRRQGLGTGATAPRSKPSPAQQFRRRPSMPFARPLPRPPT
jgi:hypothetical protein